MPRPYSNNLRWHVITHYNLQYLKFLSVPVSTITMTTFFEIAVSVYFASKRTIACSDHTESLKTQEWSIEREKLWCQYKTEIEGSKENSSASSFC